MMSHQQNMLSQFMSEYGIQRMRKRIRTKRVQYVYCRRLEIPLKPLSRTRHSRQCQSIHTASITELLSEIISAVNPDVFQFSKVLEVQGTVLIVVKP